MLKNKPFNAAHTYIAHMREYPPPPSIRVAKNGGVKNGNLAKNL